jgi:hypothetical protein
VGEHKALVELLERFHEFSDPLLQGERNGSSGVMGMPPTYTPDVREVERLLAVMRSQAKQQAYKGFGLGVLRFHVVAWYVDAERVASWYPIELKRGRRTQVPTGQQILRRQGRWVPAVRVEHPPRRDPMARRDRAELGVEWMAKHWGLGREPMVPRVRDGKLEEVAA